jgi:predicted Zn-dependent protease
MAGSTVPLNFPLRRLVAVAALALLATGCAIVAPPPPASPQPPPPAGNSVVIALLDQAADQQRAGRSEQAAASLERALRIEPGNAHVWHRLAALRLEQGQWTRAETLAAKSNQLAGGDAVLRGANWRIIAQARAALGDAAGARKARENARGL